MPLATSSSSSSTAFNSGGHRSLVLRGCGVAALLLALAWHYPHAALVTVFVGYSLALVAISVLVTLFVHCLWNAPRPARPTYYPPDLLLNVTNLPQFDGPRPARHGSQLPILFGRTVDGLLLQLLDNTIRDFVQPWLREVTRQWRQHADVWREDLWLGVQRLKERAQRCDAARLLAVDMTVRVTVHLEKIRIAQARAIDTATPAVISTSSYLATDTTELEFLRKLCEIAAIYLLPRGYSLDPLRPLLTEVIALKVLYPLVQHITSPDFLNQQLVRHIEARLAAAALHKRSYEYAASFEEFVRVINATQSIDELLLMRTSCVNDIVQATAQQQLHAARKVSTCASAALQAATATANSTSSPKTTDPNGRPPPPLNDSDADDVDGRGPDDPARRKRDAKLRRYILQLTYAKAACERCLARLGWSGQYARDPPLSVAAILGTVAGRRQFAVFLEPLQASGLIGFHTAVEELRGAPRAQYHQLGSELFYAYIRAPAPAHVRVERAVRQRMESFLLGDQGPEVFYEVQRTVFGWLEDKYHAAFVASAEYAELKRQLATEQAKEELCGDNSGDGSSSSVECVEETAAVAAASSGTSATMSGSIDDASSTASTSDVATHSTYARTKLDQLQERLDNKTHALAALRAQLKPESRLLAVLGKEVDWLRMERRQLEAHLRRTELWAEYLGAWRACVQSVEMATAAAAEEEVVGGAGGRRAADGPQFMIVVQVDEAVQERREAEAQREGGTGGGGFASGWVVLRSLGEFHELHKKLRPLCANLKSVELPSTAFKLFFLKNDRGTLEKAKGQIQRYLNFILAEDDLYQSEAIYTFLSPSSEHLKQQAAAVAPRKKFSLMTLFKADLSAQQQLAQQQQQQRANDPYWGPCGPRDGEADIYTLLDGAGDANGATEAAGTAPGGRPTLSSTASASSSGSSAGASSMDLPDAGRDSIAEPLYALAGEIFDMGGVFKFLRRSLISFVQITYGRTINRQIRDSVHACFDEQHLHAYASAALACCWPGGQLAAAAPARSTDVQQMTAVAAQSLLVDNVPEVLGQLVGAQTARRGALKVWRAVQNAGWNKQVFYELVELLMVDLFPEIRQLSEPQPQQRQQRTSTTTSPTHSQSADRI